MCETGKSMFYLGETQESEVHVEYDTEKVRANITKVNTGAFKGFVVLDDNVNQESGTDNLDDGCQVDQDLDGEERYKLCIQKSASASACMYKKLSPIIERKTDRFSENIFTREPVNKCDGHAERKYRYINSSPSQKNSDDDVFTDDADNKTVISPNIEKMMTALLFRSVIDDKEFSAIDPLDIERQISCDPKIRSTKSPSRSQSYTNSFYRKRFTRLSASNYADNDLSVESVSRRALSDSSYSESNVEYSMGFSKDAGNDSDSFWDPAGLNPKHDSYEKVDSYDKARAKEYRRNSSPKTFPKNIKSSFMSVFDLFKNKKDQEKQQVRDLRRERSFPSIFGRKTSLKSIGSSCKTSPSMKWNREDSSQSLSMSGRCTPTSKDVSPICSKRGTPKLSRESSFASLFGSKRGTPKLSRQSSLASPASKRGTPLLSRQSSGASCGTPLLSGNVSSSSASPLASGKKCHTQGKSSSCSPSRPTRMVRKPRNVSAGPVAKKLSPILVRRKSAPKCIKAQKQFEGKLKKEKSDPLIYSTKNEYSEEDIQNMQGIYKASEKLENLKLGRKTSKIRNSSVKGSRQGRRKSEKPSRSTSEHCKQTPKISRKKRGCENESLRHSRLDNHQLSLDDKIENWLENVSPGVQVSKEAKDVKPKVHFNPFVTVEPDHHLDVRRRWRHHMLLATQSLKSKKSSFSKKKQSSKEADDEVEQVNTGPVDPVYSLLKCAADLPRSGGKSPCLIHAHCSGQHTPGYSRYPSGGDSSGNTSKTSSPSSSVSHSPKTRRKKLNARMKSFSLDTPEPPKQLLGIDETTKKKSSSFTNTCFGASVQSPEEKMSVLTASNLRKKFALARASSLEIEEKKNRSYSPSPKGSPKSQRKEIKNLYVALYNFKPKEKDDIDLRAGWRVNVIDSSKKDWWKGKSHGRTGYFPATYVIPLQYDQRVFQVLQPLNLSDGNYSIKFHKDQIVLQIGEEVEGMILVRAANNRQALCPLIYLQEL